MEPNSDHGRDPDPPAPTRACNGCYLERPLTEFRKVHRDRQERHARCNDCHNAALRDRRRKGRRSALQRFHSVFTRGRHSIAAQEAVVRQMISRFRNVEGFVDAWHEELAAARRQRPGSKFVCDGMLAIFQIAVNVEEARRKAQASPDTLSDAELESEILEILARRTAGRSDGSGHTGGGGGGEGDVVTSEIHSAEPPQR